MLYFNRIKDIIIYDQITILTVKKCDKSYHISIALNNFKIKNLIINEKLQEEILYSIKHTHIFYYFGI